MSRIYTAESPIHGTGVFSSAHFWPGQTVLKIDDSRVVTDADPLDPAKGEYEHHCDYLAGGKVVLMQPPERFINHRATRTRSRGRSPGTATSSPCGRSGPARRSPTTTASTA
jgi:hypothetical protein